MKHYTMTVAGWLANIKQLQDGGYRARLAVPQGKNKDGSKKEAAWFTVWIPSYMSKWLNDDQRFMDRANVLVQGRGRHTTSEKYGLSVEVVVTDLSIIAGPQARRPQPAPPAPASTYAAPQVAWENTAPTPQARRAPPAAQFDPDEIPF